MRDGAIYIFSDFEVIRSNSRFKLTDSPFSISFTSTTIFDQLDESFGNFPKEFFRFRTHEELVSLANTNTDLPDVMGQVCSTKAYRNGMTQTLERMLVLLSLESGEKVRLSAFDHATSLEKVFSQKDVGPYILLATNINPKLFGGELYLNATSRTKFFTDGDVTTTAQFSERLKGKQKQDTNSIAPFHGVSKIEHVSIDALNQFVATGNPQAEGVLNSDCSAPIPKIVSDIVGKKFTFQLKLTNFNFTPHHQSFMVSRIYQTTELLPGPTFVETQAEGGKMVDLGDKGPITSPTRQHQTSMSSAIDISTEEKTLGSGDLPVESSSSAAMNKKHKKQKWN